MVSSSSSNSGSLPPQERLFFGGFASGIDTAGIIEALSAVDKRPITAALQRVGVLQNRQKAFATMNASLARLLTTLDPLRTETAIKARTATLGDPTNDAAKLAVSASSAAAVGSFTVEVLSLATSTKADSTAAIGQAVSQGVALDDAGFAVGPTAGTFTLNGIAFNIPAPTFTNIVSNAATGAAIDVNVPLQSAGLTLAPSATGSFVINGTTISFDSAVDSLSQIMTRINTSAAGVTASFDVAARTMTLTRTADGPTAITLSNTTGNFLEATNLVDGGNTKTGVETLGTDFMTLTDIVGLINGGGAGVTASVVNDSDGRANKLELTSGGAITLGSGGDTSNFLAMTYLLESPAGATRTSVRNLGTISTTKPLDQARGDVAIAPAVGSFSVNGTSIAYNTAVDSLNAIISRINASAAGVTATYDSYSDRLRITSNKTGSSPVSLSDTTGNFLASMKVLAATQTLGANASYKINGGATQYATTNDVSDAVAGVTLTLKQVTVSPVTVNVTADVASLRSKVQAFVEQYNSSMGILKDATKSDPAGKAQGALVGDSALRSLESALRSMITAPAFGNDSALNTLAGIGLSFGAVGAAVGSTNALVLDTAKFDAAVAADPEGVSRLLTTFSASAALDAGGTGAIQSATGTPTIVKDSGKYTLTSAVNGGLTVTFTPDNGGVPIVQTLTVSPGEVNTTLIAGMTLTFKNPLVDGTDTITVSAAEEGIGKAIYEHLDGYTRTGGVLAGRDSELQSRIDDMNKQIERMETRVAARRQALIEKYARFEVTMQRLQGQQSALGNLVNQLAGNQGRS